MRSPSPASTVFLSTPSARRATGREVEHTLRRVISIHALREEGDRPGVLHIGHTFQFLSTPSARRATRGDSVGSVRRKDFYPRPPRGGRRTCHAAGILLLRISIHALREEGDSRYRSSATPQPTFLSTPSARRATSSYAWLRSQGIAISIHALREEGDQATNRRLVPTAISIHALREEGDRRGAGCSAKLPISIHALREEGDQIKAVFIKSARLNFYPRPPRGGRRVMSELEGLEEHISIHALREEGDGRIRQLPQWQ